MGTSDLPSTGGTAAERSLIIDSRFCGPPGTGNGGYVAGCLAALLPVDGPIQVTLREPPPLDIPLVLSTEDIHPVRVTARVGGAAIAHAEPGALMFDCVDPVSFQAALHHMQRFAGLVQHPFPTCFVCGPLRPAPDGLGLRPGRLNDRPDTVATAWVPHESITDGGRVPAAMVWAALDCPGGWSTDLLGRPMVLGRVTAVVDAIPEVGDRCVVLGQFLRHEGRKTFTVSTAYDGDGRILGRAEAIWFEVDPSRFDAN